MCLRFMFLLTTRLAAWLRLTWRAETWKTAEILILRGQLGVLQRQQPRRLKLNWADRALLATLLAVIPKARRHGLQLLVTPDTIVRRHRRSSVAAGPQGRCAARPAGQRSAGTSGTGPAAGPREPRMELPQDPRGAGWPGSENSGPQRCGKS